MDCLNFNNIEKLYHYTSLESACYILSSNTLRYGRLSNMNDINEAYKRIFYNPQGDCDKYKDILQELNSYGQISLSSDGKRNGYAIPAMWGHYANKGRGVCLVFDRKQLLSNLPSNAKADKITYKFESNGNVIIKESVSSFFEDQLADLFFTKTDDWEYEQEFRIIKKIQETDILNFKDSLAAIIIHETPRIKNCESIWDSTNVKILRKICPDHPILLFNDWLGDNTLTDDSGHDWIAPKQEISLDV